MILVWIILFIAWLTIMAYQRVSLSVWTIGMAFFLLLLSVFSHLGLIGISIIWLIFLVITVPLNCRWLRRKLITRPILAAYQKAKPSISATERAALSIGTVGWEGELFNGMPDWQKFSAYPAMTLSVEEQLFLSQEVEQLCAMLNNWDINHNRFNLPPEVWQFLKEKGFFGLIIPKKYGGKEFSPLAHSAVITKIAGVCNAAATVVGVPNSLGPAELLLEYGTLEQKEYYLPRLARGEEIPCFALTSPEAGSDAGSMPDKGVVCKGQWEGKEIIGIRLHWDKRYITLAPIATLLGLAFKLLDPEHLLSAQEAPGITCALIPTHLPGIHIGRRHYPLNSAFPNGPTQGKDVFIPVDWIIGGAKMAGQGWQMLLERLSVGRAISLPSLSTGGAKMAAFTSGAYTRIRKQFHVSVGRFEGVKEALTRIAGYTYIMEATRLFAIAAVQRGEQPAIPSAISKYHTTELGRQVMNDAMDVHGGKGISMGPNNYLAQAYVEVPIAITVEGANILTRCMMIFGQGVLRCHPYLFAELKATEHPDSTTALKEFDRLFFAHLGFIMSNKARAFLLGISHGYFAAVPGKGISKRYYRQFTRFSAAFAFMTDIILLYFGGDFKRKEHLSGRMADVLSMLYMGSAVLKQFENQGSPAEDLPLLQWSCETLLHRLQTAFDSILNNFPNRFLAVSLRLVIFPCGKRMKAPNDRLSNQVAGLFSSTTATRYRLAEGAYLSPREGNLLHLIDLALQKCQAAEEIEKKIHHAKEQGLIHSGSKHEKIAAALAAGIITLEESAVLEEEEKLRKIIITVDDFAAEDLEK